MSNYKATHIDQIEVVDDGRAPFRAVRGHFGITSFGINTWTADAAGERLINEHDEADVNHEELYVVIAGRARFEIDGDSVDAPAGTYVYVAPEGTRTAFAEEAGTTLIALGGTPGEVYRVLGWESWSRLRPFYDAGQYAEASALARQMLAEDDQPPFFYYNTACVEALAGEHDQAVEHLRQAIAGDAAAGEMAQSDSDFDSLRDDPRFKELVAG